ncbi:hypothetical protein CBL_01177 [Carabus blaptoides fortunei]
MSFFRTYICCLKPEQTSYEFNNERNDSSTTNIPSLNETPVTTRKHLRMSVKQRKTPTKSSQKFESHM